MDISAVPQQSRGFRPLPFWTGIVLVGLPVLLVIIAPMISPLNPLRQSLRMALAAPDLAAPDLAAPFGYDHLGRSLMARLAEALRLSLMVAALSALSAAAIGLALGVTASRLGVMTDRLLTLLADSFMAIPGLLIVLMIGVIVPWKPLAFWLGLTLVLWIEFFRLARAASRPIFASPAVQASGLLGFGKAYVFRRHVWPELAPVMLTSTAFDMATCIMTIAALGFVSAGVRPPTPELGQMMVELMPYWREAPWALLQPVAAIFSLILGLNLIAGSRS